MAQISNCLKLLSKIDERDQDALVARLDELQAQGMPAERAQIQAAIDVLTAVQGENAPLVRSITREQALKTNVRTEMPKDPVFEEAVANTTGARVDDEGLHMRLMRWQKPEQEAGRAIRTGVFYLPDGSSNSRHYRSSPSADDKQSYGGSVKMDGETLIRRPLFVRGATGGKAPESAYDAIKGKGAMKKLDSDVFGVINERNWMTRQGGDDLYLERVRNLLRDHGADPQLAADIIRYSRQGNQLRYALQENIIAHTVRAAGYDAVVGYSKGKAGAFISEVFDVREQTFPSNIMESDVHEDFLASATRSASRQTETPEFKRWFGDSKVVDADGKPLVVYHGTSRDFEPEGYMWFAEDPSTSDAYSRKMLDEDGAAPKLIPAYLKMENPLEINADGNEYFEIEFDGEFVDTEFLAAKAVADGHDGLIVYNAIDEGSSPTNIYYATSPANIKSATGNSGAFDPNNANITRSLPRAIIAGDLGSLNNDTDYTAAKSGDLDAALRLAGRVVDADLAEQLNEIENPIVVGVLAIESSGRNAIPRAAAGVLANRLDAERDTEIIQSSSPKRTALAGLDRIFSRPEFAGDVESGRNYILVDDTITQGGTFAALGRHIESSGGNVAGIVALSGKQYSAILTVEKSTLNTLREKFGDVENEFEQATGYRYDDLTQSEARYLASFKPADAVRDRIIAQAGQGLGRQDRGAPGEEVTRSLPRPEFFSQLQRSIEQVPDRLATMAAPQWKLWLDANAPKLGVKKDEIEWSGIGDYLKLRGKDKVTRDELVAYLADSGVRVQEVVLGGGRAEKVTLVRDSTRRDAWGEVVVYRSSDGAFVVENGIGGKSWSVQDAESYDSYYSEDDGSYAGDFKSREAVELFINGQTRAPNRDYDGVGSNPETNYGTYTVPGGENYREVLITLPTRYRKFGARYIPESAGGTPAYWAVAPVGAAEAGQGFGRYTDQESAEREAARRSEIAASPMQQQFEPGQYSSNHWDQLNILAHLRIDDRTDADGNKVLFINEIQSDWGQDGKKKGFASNYKTEDVKLLPAGDQAAVQSDVFWYFQVPGNVLQIAKSRYATEAAAREYIIRENPVNPYGVPAAPFISDTKAWASLALKRAIMMAVEGGHDKIAIITGEQAADLYDLSKRVDMVSVSPAGEGRYDLTVNLIDGGKQFMRDKSPKDLEDTIGKELAERAITASDSWVAANKAYRDELRKDNTDDAELDRLRAVRDAIETELTGDDLVIGGEGMRAFYDQIIPQVARDVLKKLGGGQLQQIDVGTDFDIGTDDDLLDGKKPTQNRSTQMGFDITPAMREKVASGVPLFSKGRTTGGADWESPSASKFDDLVYKFQDKQIETKRVVEAIKEASGSLRDDLNVYLNEELYHGRAAKRTEDFVNMELNPLIEDMAKAGMTIVDLEEFLHARHAKEANAVIAQRNPGEPGLQDGGSGMTNAEADNYMATLPAADRQKLEAAANKVDAIIGGTRKMFVDYELESQATVDGWNGLFKHYVPLQREDKEGSPGLGQGFSIKGKETKGRTGSTRKVVDILANIAMQRERAIVRGEKNRVAQSLVGLVRANENPDFWLVDEVPTERVFNPATGLVEDRVDPMYKSRENAVVAKIKDPSGAVREHAVLFNEDDPRALRMAKALKNLDAPDLEGLLGVSAKITRYFAAISTQYNPIFGAVNLVRDVQAAMINLSSTPLKGDQKKIAKYTASALAGIYGDLRKARSGKNGTSAWAKLWDEFQEVGGQTGYRDLFRNSGDRARAIEKALNPTGWMDSKLGKIFTAGGALRVPMVEAQKGAGWLFDLLSDYNDALENGTRLAAYKAGLERGLTKQQAASIAKNLTTSFNRKGNQATQAGALYAFFNAAIQGTARIGETLFDMEPGKPKTLRLSSVGKKVVYGGIVLGSVQALALAAAGFNDEDPPPFSRERNLIIPTGGKTYVSIPMPLGLHVIPNIGRMTTEFILNGFKDPAKRTIDMVSLFADAFNPIGSAGLSMQTLAPTALDPLVALTENRDWTGKPIARTSTNRAIPGHTLGRDTATTFAELLSEAINSVSGGNEHLAGVFSPTPDQIDYLVAAVTGGVGREYAKTEQTLKAAIRGESLPTYKIPLVGRFVGNAKGQASEGNAFYANVEKLNRIETEVKGLRADGKTAEAQAVLSENKEAYLITQANYAERLVQKLRKQKSELVKAGAPREQVKTVEEETTKVMARLNRAMEALEAAR